MAYKDLDKETSKWVLGGDGITNIRIPSANIEAVKKINKQKKLVRKPKKEE